MDFPTLTLTRRQRPPLSRSSIYYQHLLREQGYRPTVIMAADTPEPFVFGDYGWPIHMRLLAKHACYDLETGSESQVLPSELIGWRPVSNTCLVLQKNDGKEDTLDLTTLVAN